MITPIAPVWSARGARVLDNLLGLLMSSNRYWLIERDNFYLGSQRKLESNCGSGEAKLNPNTVETVPLAQLCGS
jgi:hypothetical protein